jgi:hypothetical protein
VKNLKFSTLLYCLCRYACNRSGQKRYNSRGGGDCLHLRVTTLPPSPSRFSIKCGIPNIHQPYRPPRSATGIALLFIYKCSYLTGNTSVDLDALFTGIALLSIRRCLYFTGNTIGPPRPVTGIALLFIYRCSYLTENTIVPPRPVTGIALPFYIDVRTSQETSLGLLDLLPYTVHVHAVAVAYCFKVSYRDLFHCGVFTPEH